jgi:hypothetical protein
MVQTIQNPDGKKNTILIKYFITRTRKDSILNKSYSTNLDNGKPGFKRMNI